MPFVLRKCGQLRRRKTTLANDPENESAHKMVTEMQLEVLQGVIGDESDLYRFWRDYLLTHYREECDPEHPVAGK